MVDGGATTAALLEELKAARQEIANARSIADNSRDNIMRFDREFRHTFVNRAASDMAGFSAGETLGKTPREIGFPAALCDLWEAKIASVFDTGQSAEVEFDIELPGGKVWMDMRLHPELDADGHVCSVLAASRDITHRKRAEEALRQRTAELEALFGASPDLSFRLRADGTIVDFHAGRAADLYTTPDQFLGRRMQDVLPPDVGEQFVDTIGRAQAGSMVSMEYALVVPSGAKTFEARVMPLQDSELYVLVRDITERKLAEERASYERGLMQTLMSCIPDFVYFKDRDRRFVRASLAFCDLLQVGPEDIIGRRDEELFAPEVAELTADDDRRVIETGTPIVNKEECGGPVDGATQWVLTTKMPWYDDGGDIIGLYGISRNITDRKRAEQERRQLEAQLQQAQKLEGLGVLASGIAHDFNNLLVGIYGNMDLALREQQEGSSSLRYLADAKTAAGRAAELVGQMLTYAGKEKPNKENIDLSALVQEMAGLLETPVSKKTVFRLELAEDLLPAHADPTQIRQVVMNLITNAAQAIGEKSGEIVVGTEMAECDADLQQEIRPGVKLPSGAYIRLRVSDTGSGVDEETRSRIFDPFFTTKATGSGLGLSVVHGIVRSHLGVVEVDSEPGKGTQFTIMLPASHETTVQDAGPVSEDWRGSGTVLLVDDTEMVRVVVAEMLELSGFSVLMASDGNEAVALFRERCHEIDCILLDSKMPGMGGEETYDEIRRISESVPVILSSGQGAQESAEQFGDKGVAGFLRKPYEVADLQDMLRTVMGD